MAEDKSAEATVSLNEVLEENSAREAEARAVLGASDSKNCTYPKGALGRQAIFACATCIPTRMPGVKAAGVCLACSLVCHEGHEVFELYTKRDFRCDCGNSRFDGARCRLYPDKAPENEGNSYNHNFLGNYCTCDRPYPDPEQQDESMMEEAMLQCILCEDWFHERHLGRPVPDDYEEMVCDGCVKRCPFLNLYALHSGVSESTESEMTASATEDMPTAASVASTSSTSATGATASGSDSTAAATAVAKDLISHDSSIESLERPCDLQYRRSQCVSKGATAEKAAYFKDGWRADLCTCASCLVLYEELSVTFLPDINDTTAAYEELGQSDSPSGHSTGSLEDQGMEALGSLPLVQQVELSTEYNNMKTELSAFLRPFAAAGKVVSDEDIRRFFDQLKDRKRRPPGDGMPPGGCGMP